MSGSLLATKNKAYKPKPKKDLKAIATPLNGRSCDKKRNNQSKRFCKIKVKSKKYPPESALLRRAKLVGYQRYSGVSAKYERVGETLSKLDNGTPYSSLSEDERFLVDHHLNKISGWVFLNRAERTAKCHQYKHVTYHMGKEIIHAHKCKDRLCVACNALKARANAKLLAEYLVDSGIASDPNTRLFMLTFTVKNLKVEECHNAVNVMHRAFNYLFTTEKNGLKDRFAPPGKGGYLRGTEVLGTQTDLAHGLVHPHIHVLVLVDWAYYSDKKAKRFINMRAKKHELSKMWQRALLLKKNRKIKDYATGKDIEMELEGKIVDMRVVYNGDEFADKDRETTSTALYKPIHEVNKGFSTLPKKTGYVEEWVEVKKEKLAQKISYPTLLASGEQIKRMKVDYFMKFCEQTRGLKLWSSGGIFVNLADKIEEENDDEEGDEEDEEAMGSKCGLKGETLPNPERLEVYRVKEGLTFEEAQGVFNKKSVACFADCIGSCGSVVGNEYPTLAKIHRQELTPKIRDSLEGVSAEVAEKLRNPNFMADTPIALALHTLTLALLHKWTAERFKAKDTEVTEGGWVASQLRKAFVYDGVNKALNSSFSMFSYVNPGIEDLHARITGVDKKTLKKMKAFDRDELIYSALNPVDPNDEDEEPPKAQAVQESKEPQELRVSEVPPPEVYGKWYVPPQQDPQRVHAWYVESVRKSTRSKPKPSPRRSVVKKCASLFSALDKLEPSVSSARVAGVEPSNPFVPDNYQPPTKTDKPAKASKKKKERGEHPYLKRKREQAQRALVAEDKELIAFSFASDSECAPVDYDPSVFGDPQDTFIPDDWQTPDDAFSDVAFAMCEAQTDETNLHFT
ncbi:hypothetical protein HHE06_07450 [Helicobacter heilmannii]|uniref:protein rep n=1 Tax=Helicobacter heilmannii TaxID=35817 RepID=UPI0006A0109D|nr:protein rep [Helicobacter heilmannii]CRF50889.1 hypothetical protein HHE06_07450 [Helicobacter heilmannii]